MTSEHKLEKDLPVLGLALFAGMTPELQRVPLELCIRSRYQTREQFEDEALQELAEQMRQMGTNYNPVILKPEGERFEIVSGERRWRAAQLAGLDGILAIVGQFSDVQAQTINITENLQREDLNALEEAEAIKKLLEIEGVTHKEAAKAIGKSRVYVTNMLRLLELDLVVRDYVRAGRLSGGAARALAGLDKHQQRQLAFKAVRNTWSVRKVEEEARKLRQQPADLPPSSQDPDIRHAEDDLSAQVGSPLRIRHNRSSGSGRLELVYFDASDFESLLSRLGLNMPDMDELDQADEDRA